MAEKRRTVVVGRDGIHALEEPRFLVQHEGKLYLTVAVLEYDPDHPELEDEHKETIGQLQTHLETGTQVRAAAAPVQMSAAIIAANAVGPGTGDGGGG